MNLLDLNIQFSPYPARKKPLNLSLDFEPTMVSAYIDTPLYADVVFPPDTTGLKDYQSQGTNFLAGRERAILADDMGLGKTVQSLRAIRGPTIVVCPSSLKLVWKEEASIWRPDLIVEILKPSDLRAPRRNELLIASYDSLPEAYSETQLIPDNLRHVTLIADEAHKAKSAEAQRSERIKLLASQCGRVWVMTGTPLLGTPQDLWGILDCFGLVDLTFGDWDNFVDAFGGKRGKWGIDWPSTPRRRKYVEKCLAKVMLRRLKKDVLPELPLKTYRRHFVEVPTNLLDELRDADEKWHELGIQALPPFEMLSKLRAELAKSRIPDLIEYVSRVEQTGEPLVVFADHVDPILALEGRPGWGVFTGATPLRERKRLVDLFQAGELVGIAMTIGTGGVGFTLTRAAHAVFASLSYTPGNNEQAEDRIVRIGQAAKKCFVTFLVTDHPVERRLLDILATKQRLIHRTMNRPRYAGFSDEDLKAQKREQARTARRAKLRKKRKKEAVAAAGPVKPKTSRKKPKAATAETETKGSR